MTIGTHCLDTFTHNSNSWIFDDVHHRLDSGRAESGKNWRKQTSSTSFNDVTTHGITHFSENNRDSESERTGWLCDTCALTLTLDHRIIQHHDLVCAQWGGQHRFKLKWTTKMGSLIRGFTKRKGVEPGTFRFFYNGKFVNPSDTPRSLHMENNDNEIDAFMCVHDIPSPQTHAFHTPTVKPLNLCQSFY